MPSAGIKPGNVPTARVGPILDSLIRERWPYGGGHEILAEKVGCEQSTIATIIEQQWEGVEFDLADSLLCALGRWDIWHGVLEDIYPTKFWSTCSLPGCDRRFAESSRGRHGPKKYCCKAHAKLAYDVRHGNAVGLFRRKRGYCLKGHKIAGKNAKRITNGTFQCRICDNERRRKRRASSPELRERAREYDRAYRTRKKAALAA